MSKYEYGRLSMRKKRDNNWYVRLKEWKSYKDERGDLQDWCRVIKTFRTPEECIKYIEWLNQNESVV